MYRNEGDELMRLQNLMWTHITCNSPVPASQKRRQAFVTKTSHSTMF